MTITDISEDLPDRIFKHGGRLYKIDTDNAQDKYVLENKSKGFRTFMYSRKTIHNDGFLYAKASLKDMYNRYYYHFGIGSVAIA